MEKIKKIKSTLLSKFVLARIILVLLVAGLAFWSGYCIAHWDELKYSEEEYQMLEKQAEEYYETVISANFPSNMEIETIKFHSNTANTLTNLTLEVNQDKEIKFSRGISSETENNIMNVLAIVLSAILSVVVLTLIYVVSVWLILSVILGVIYLVKKIYYICTL